MGYDQRSTSTSAGSSSSETPSGDEEVINITIRYDDDDDTAGESQPANPSSVFHLSTGESILFV